MKPHRTGLTLIELLVSLGIVAILLGLLLSGVQKVRHAAQKIACQRQFQQIGLAAQMRHDTDGTLPAPPRVPTTRKFHNMGWLPFLLPYVEQEVMWHDVQEDYRRLTIPYSSLRPHRHLGTVVPIFGCPGDERTRTAWTVPDLGHHKPIAVTSYLGNAGTTAKARDGVLYKGAATKLQHISDGTSSTLLAGERPPSPEMIFGWWYAGYGVNNTSLFDLTMTVQEPRLKPPYPWYQKCPPGPHRFQARQLDDFCGVFQYWSVHQGGAYFAFTDGSVRFLRYEASDWLPALATRAGGETVQNLE